jgi:hypothetical protein
VCKWVALVLLSLLLAGACEKRDQAAQGGGPREGSGSTGTQSPGSEVPPTPAEGEVLPTREITLRRETAPPATGPARDGKPLPAAAGPAPAGGMAAALLPLGGPALLPEDFRIGPLEDRLTAGGAEQKILKAAAGFLDALVSGTFAEAIVLPEKRPDLRRSLAYYIEEGLVPATYRLGAIYLEQGPSTPESASLNLRLYGSPGVAEGEMYLSLREGTWYVTDIQAGFPFLGEPYARETEKFVPSVYGWRLQ